MVPEEKRHAGRGTPPGPGQESVWDYPRPPRVEPVAKTIRVEFNGEVIASSDRAYRVLETSHPPVYYVPVADVTLDFIEPNLRRSWCEWKGQGHYWSVRVKDRFAAEAAWSYPDPSPGFEVITDHLAFYPDKMDACFVGEERVTPQPGDFYGGWVTRNVVGPFKGGPGTWHW
jgi:uncharacterized protein (DUF427 family)